MSRVINLIGQSEVFVSGAQVLMSGDIYLADNICAMYLEQPDEKALLVTERTDMQSNGESRVTLASLAKSAVGLSSRGFTFPEGTDVKEETYFPGSVGYSAWNSIFDLVEKSASVRVRG
jgi:hypothetical protein